MTRFAIAALMATASLVSIGGVVVLLGWGWNEMPELTVAVVGITLWFFLFTAALDKDDQIE